MDEDGSRYFSDQRGRLPRRESVELADHILRREKQTRPVNIIVVDDAAIRTLNKQYRNRSRPTDVLAFPADPELGILGEVYISVDTARRQAAEYSHRLREEMLRLVAHGVLHLCGYDHEHPTDAAVMKEREDAYLDGILSHV